MILFGERLRNLREKRDIARAKLGDRVGVSGSMIGLYETGQRYPSLPVLIAISRYFGVSVDYMLGLSDVQSEFVDVAGLDVEQVNAIITLVEQYRFLIEKASRDQNHKESTPNGGAHR